MYSLFLSHKVELEGWIHVHSGLGMVGDTGLDARNSKTKMKNVFYDY